MEIGNMELGPRVGGILQTIMGIMGTLKTSLVNFSTL